MTYLEDAASSAATAANEVQALRAVENAQRAELRAERLQHRLDESLDANKTLRQPALGVVGLAHARDATTAQIPGHHRQGRRT